MNKIFKICIILAIFLASASLAWAGLNYDSARNYYLLDSALKIGGSYIVVGSALTSHADSLVASNNIILTDKTGLFSSSDNPTSQELGIASNEAYIKTPSVTLDNEADLKIFASGSPLVISSAPDTLHLELNSDLRLLKNLLIGQGTITASSGNIYVSEIRAKNILLLTAQALAITSGNQIVIKSADGDDASADSILLGDEQFCEVVDYSVAVENSRQNVKIDSDKSNDKSIDDMDCTDLNADTTADDKSANRTCCREGYYVFDIWEGRQWDPKENKYIGKGIMVCCRYAESKLIMLN